MWDQQVNETGKHEAVPVWVPSVHSAPPYGPEVHAPLAAWVQPRGGVLLHGDEQVAHWFRTHWYGPQPPTAFSLRTAVIATLRVEAYAALLTANTGHRCVYLAAWLADTSISPRVVARYETMFTGAGFRVTIDDGGLIAESENPGNDPLADIGTALQVAEGLGALAAELSGVSNLPST
jgi:hypothetical protein